MFHAWLLEQENEILTCSQLIKDEFASPTSLIKKDER